ncbi:serotransferrin-B-like [Mixophyes fleayi]|uniref:serotransferrin-B-like n=1 Tax=Mixophyes fleayi TaxID=3061075 RepID=UPI003F4DAD12
MAMASTLQLTLCFGILALCLAAPTKNVRWCVKSEAELKKCRDLAKSCGTQQISLTCVLKSNTDDCFKAIAGDLADAITLDSGDIYRSSLHPYTLKPILAENYGTNKDADTCYFPVALVKTSSTFMFKDLKGKRSCHTGVNKAAGWVAPIGNLLKTGQLQWSGPEDQSIEKAVSGFFSASCAPGAKEPNLCKQCAGKGDKKCKTSQNEPYYNYDGARRCLKDDKGDVAFVNQIIPDEFSKGYELLCLDNKRRPISEYAKCNLGRIPAHAVVSVDDESKIQAIKEFLQTAQSKPECKLFSSTHGKDLLFKDSATGLRVLPAKMDAFMYLGASFANAYKALHNELEKPSDEKIRWCTQSREEKNKCDTWSISSKGAIECVEAGLAEECIAKIVKSEADVVTLDGGYLYTAGECGLVPAMGEIYDAEECRKRGSSAPGSYFTIAVAKKSNKGITWNNLQGKKSCHTGVGRTAGWNIPVGLINNKTGICDMAQFFKESCAPGADINSNLCKLCVGDPQKSLDSTKCSANNKELYYGYEGSLRCLIEKGDIAFMKETTLFENIKGADSPAWAKGSTLDDFELLCKDGSRRPVNAYKECNLAEVPAHAVACTPEKRQAVVNILKEQEAQFGRKKDKSAQLFQMFSSDGRKDQLFKDSTQCLRETTGSMRDFLGQEYMDAISSLNKCSNTKSELLTVCTFHTCKT